MRKIFCYQRLKLKHSNSYINKSQISTPLKLKLINSVLDYILLFKHFCISAIQRQLKLIEFISNLNKTKSILFQHKHKIQNICVGRQTDIWFSHFTLCFLKKKIDVYMQEDRLVYYIFFVINLSKAYSSGCKKNFYNC